MNNENVQANGQLQEILESYQDLFGDLSNQYNLDKGFYDLKYEDFLTKNSDNSDIEYPLSLREVENAQSETINNQDDAVLLSQNLSDKHQSNDEFIEELKDCIRKINEKKESPILK